MKEVAALDKSWQWRWQLQQQVKGTRTESVPTGGAWKTLTTAVLFERWELHGTESNKTLTWASLPYYFVSVVTDKGYSTHTTLSRCVWTACLCWLEKWQPMDSYEGSRVMAKLNYVHAICQWWPYHCFCLLTPSSVIMWLCFDMTVAMCMVCVCILLPIHALLQPDCSLMGEFQDIMNFELWTTSFRG